MKLLLDTHLLLWAAGEPRRLSKRAPTLIDNPDNELLFSAATGWDVAVKRGLGRQDSQVAAWLLHRGLSRPCRNLHYPVGFVCLMGAKLWRSLGASKLSGRKLTLTS